MPSTLKRKIPPSEVSIQKEDVDSSKNYTQEQKDKEQEEQSSQNGLNIYLTRFKKFRKDPLPKGPKVPINLRPIKIEKGCFNLTKEIMLEALYHNNKILMMFKNSNGRQEYFYKCVAPSCNYMLKIFENKELIGNLSTQSLLNNFKSFDITSGNDSEQGIITIEEIGEHKDHPNDFDKFCEKLSSEKQGISHLLKQIIQLEKLYLSKPLSCQTKLKTMLDNNNLTIQLPEIVQLRNYLYRYREQLISNNYPEVKKYLTEIVKKTYNQELKDDETFFIYSSFNNGEISIMFSTRNLIQNLINQAQNFPSFIHLDSTFKLIDLGLPVMIISTENINHNLRPVAYLVTWSESIAVVVSMIKNLTEFLRTNFNFEFRPQYVMTDNSDAFISGIKQAFNHHYVHMTCHFHLMKNLKEKTQKSDLKDLKAEILCGVKFLKNSGSEEFFTHVWKIVKEYWKQKNVPENFIKTFEKEYINKPVKWFYGCSFYGKSYSNNSVESGNKLLKDFFNRKPQNIKVFLAKIQDFLREWSTLEKTSFSLQVEYKKFIIKEAEKIVKENAFLSSPLTPNCLYYPRKGIPANLIETNLQHHLNREILPANIDDLFKNFGNFRTINKELKSCDCSSYHKYKYCKHLIAIMIVDEELHDPEVKEKKKRGRKKFITTALNR